eukprot:1186437-Prorocentrum_minimum.AAC.4
MASGHVVTDTWSPTIDQMASWRPLRVGFLHPDLGLAPKDEGAPRGRAEWVHVHGDFIPRHIFGRFHALLANLRCAWAAFVLAVHNIFFFPRYDVVIVDQMNRYGGLRVSLPVLLLRWFTRTKVPQTRSSFIQETVMPPDVCLLLGRVRSDYLLVGLVTTCSTRAGTSLDCTTKP